MYFTAPPPPKKNLPACLTQRRTNTHSTSSQKNVDYSSLICFTLGNLVTHSSSPSASSPRGFSSEEIVRGWGRWAASASGRGLAVADAVVRAEELLVSSLVGVSLPQHSSQLTLQLLQLRTDRKDEETASPRASHKDNDSERGRNNV